MESMSKQSIKLDTDPIATFLTAISISIEWKSSDHKPTASISQNSIVLSAIKEKNTNIVLYLERHEKQPLWLVVTFWVVGKNNLAGAVALGHYGKRFAKKGIGGNDFESKDLSEFWTVKCASDIESLFRAHDNQSRIHGAELVFNLPLR